MRIEEERGWDRRERLRGDSVKEKGKGEEIIGEGGVLWRRKKGKEIQGGKRRRA